MSETSIQDRYLDLLIEIAFEQQEQQAVDRLLQTPDPVLTPEQAIRAAQAFRRGLNKTALLQQRERRARRRSRVRCAALAAGRCLIYLLAACNLLLPVAYAASPDFRGAVLKLLWSDPSHLNLTISAMVANIPKEDLQPPPPDEDFAFLSGPDRWKGLMFPRSIPLDYELAEVSADGLSARYVNGDSGFTFVEHGRNSQSIDGISYDTAEESEGTVYPLRVVDYEKDGKPRTGVAFTLSHAYWYELIGENMERETLVEIMDSIGFTFQLEPADTQSGAPPSAEAEPPRALPPSCWEGRYYPAYLPAGFKLQRYAANSMLALASRSIFLRSAAGAVICFAEDIINEMPENSASVSGTRIENGKPEKIMINGTEAVAANGYDGGGNSASIMWEKDSVLFTVTTSGLSMEETRRIAESVRPLDAEERPPRWTSDRPEGEDAVPPSCWQGEYYPAELPGGYELTGYNGLEEEKLTLSRQTDGAEIEMTETLSDQLPFRTIESGRAKLTALEDAEILILEGSEYGVGRISMYIPCGGRWFVLGLKGIGMEDGLRIAESLRRLRPEENAAFPTIPAAVPASWAGEACLSALPEAMEFQAENASPDCLLWRGSAGGSIRLRFFSSPAEMPIRERSTVFRVFSVNGRTAYEFITQSFGVSFVSFLWHDADGWYILDTERLSAAEAEQIAGCVRLIPAEERKP